jgi:hypothetical protein
MKATIATVGESFPFTLQEVDISTDPDLEARYGLEIPVLMVGEKKVAKYRVSAEGLTRILTAKENG